MISIHILWFYLSRGKKNFHIPTRFKNFTSSKTQNDCLLAIHIHEPPTDPRFERTTSQHSTHGGNKSLSASLHRPCSQNSPILPSLPSALLSSIPFFLTFLLSLTLPYAAKCRPATPSSNRCTNKTDNRTPTRFCRRLQHPIFTLTLSSLFVMAGLAQVALHSATRKITAQNITKDVTRLISSSSKLNGHKHQYQTPPTKVKKTSPAVAWKSAAVAGRRIDSVAASLASKGFLRAQNPYVPPQDVADRVREIFSTIKIPTDSNLEERPLEDKFAILQACSANFNHSVPNSRIHEIKTFDAIVDFYETPVDTITPLDALQRAQLPENLHVQYDYVRFHPETDTMFGGKSAFPKSSTLVTGLKYRNKYQGHIAKRSWP